MAAGTPLPALLSQALVAFTVEFDNEFEHQTPHRTTRHGSTGGAGQGPWLCSLVMWSNCMRFVGEHGVRVGELEDVARTKTNLNGMQRWGYIRIAPDPADTRPKPPQAEWVIHATAKGLRAREVWGPLFGVIEKRWAARFGQETIDQLRRSLGALDGEMNLDLPECLPILGYGLFSRAPNQVRRMPENRQSPDRDLSALLARVLLAFAVEFEAESELSLAISANVLRVLDEQGVRVRDIPILAGVSKEAVSMAMGIVEKKRMAIVEPDPAASRAKVARLTPHGLQAQAAYHDLLSGIEKRWQARFGYEAIGALREPLERLAGSGVSQSSPLFVGLEPYPDGWRASVRKPELLPHYPMVLHRGGFPDGS